MEFDDVIVNGTLKGPQITEDGPCVTISLVDIDLNNYPSANLIGGSTITNGDRVLLAGQTTESENGPYVVDTTGINMVFTRTSEAEDGDTLRSSFINIVSGDNANTAWLCTTNGALVGTDPIRYKLGFDTKDWLTTGAGTGAQLLIDTPINGLQLRYDSDVIRWDYSGNLTQQLNGTQNTLRLGGLDISQVGSDLSLPGIVTNSTITTIDDLEVTQSIKLDSYGAGSQVGTATRLLAVDSAGNIIEEPLPTPGDTNTIYNASDSLAGNRVVNLAGFNLIFGDTGESGALTIEPLVLSATQPTINIGFNSQVNISGPVDLSSYGQGNQLGTPDYLLGVDGSGNLVEYRNSAFYAYSTSSQSFTTSVVVNLNTVVYTTGQYSLSSGVVTITETGVYEIIAKISAEANNNASRWCIVCISINNVVVSHSLGYGGISGNNRFGGATSTVISNLQADDDIRLICGITTGRSADTVSDACSIFIKRLF
jgi:hypothetical protein